MLGHLGELKSARMDDMVEGYLRQSVVTMAALMQHFADPAWLMRQNAADLAVLYGMTFEKFARVMAAMQTAQDQREQAGETLTDEQRAARVAGLLEKAADRRDGAGENGAGVVHVYVPANPRDDPEHQP